MPAIIITFVVPRPCRIHWDVVSAPSIKKEKDIILIYFVLYSNMGDCTPIRVSGASAKKKKIANNIIDKSEFPIKEDSANLLVCNSSLAPKRWATKIVVPPHRAVIRDVAVKKGTLAFPMAEKYSGFKWPNNA